MSFTVVNSGELTAKTEPTVTHDSYVEIPGYGKVKATFDFSELHPSMHHIALSVLRGKTIHPPRY